MAPDVRTRARITGLLEAGREGDPQVLDHLVPLIYDELREMAHGQLGREPSHVTLQTTALVHEAYLRLAEKTQVTARGRAYFFAAAAQAMHRVLVDRARRRRAQKRGSGQTHLSLDENQIAVDDFAADLLDLDRVLDALAERNPRLAQVVECRFFGGMTIEETAEALGVSPRTVQNDWKVARAWLYRALEQTADE